MDVCVIQAVRSSIRSITQAHRTPGIRRQLRLCSTNTQCARQTGQGKDPLPAAVQKQISFLACNGRVSSPFSNRLNKLLRQTLNYTVLQSRMVRHATSSASRTTKATSYEGVKERTEISMETYHQHADHYLNDVQQVMEELQEEREDVDVEYSVRITASVSHDSVFSVPLPRCSVLTYWLLRLAFSQSSSLQTEPTSSTNSHPISKYG